MDRPRPKAVKRYAAVTPLGDRRCLLSRRLLPRIRYEQALAETALAGIPDQPTGIGSEHGVGKSSIADHVDESRAPGVKLLDAQRIAMHIIALDQLVGLHLVPH